jgi:hypothetical protein
MDWAWLTIGVILIGVTVVGLAAALTDAIGEWRYHNDPSHCEWCGIELTRWRVLLNRRYCSVCAPRMLGDAGIYGQAGGPPCSKDAHRGQTERRPVRTGTVSCECGWSRRQHWWLPGFTVRQISELHYRHRVTAHPETMDR